MLEESVYLERLDQVEAKIIEWGGDFAILTPSSSFLYLTGIDYEMRERLVALILQPGKEPSLLVPAFEATDHASHTWIDQIIPWQEDEDPYKKAIELVGTAKGQGRVLLDDSTPLGVYWALASASGGFATSTSITPTINGLRLVKSKQELNLMRKAGGIIDKAVMKGFRTARIGMSELELQQVVNDEIIRQGGKPTFAAIQFGENSARPHAEAGSRDLRKGDVVLMDCGCSLDGYNTDQTRVGVVGEPSEEIERVYSTVLQAEETAIARIEPGVVCGAADGIARRVIEDAGYGEYFTHRLGHGIGLEVHEPPYLVRGNPLQLARGMCHSVEPGIYLEGKFGIRMEDLVCITDDGCEVITYSPKDLHEIPI